MRLGISACLLGQAVRYDGGHKRDHFLVDVLGPRVEWVPVCPEVEIGLGTPRPPLNLVRLRPPTTGGLRMIAASTGVDHTDAMNAWARRTVEELERQRLSGYVLKKNSPSCGMQGVKVHNADGTIETSGRGLFAEWLMRHFPSLPIEEEGRLADPAIREDFLNRVYEYHRQHG